jgi:hypothetical protein
VAEVFLNLGFFDLGGTGKTGAQGNRGDMKNT